MEAGEILTDAGAAKRSWFIGRVWRGEYPLRLSFWGLSVGIGVLMLLFWSNVGGTVARPGSPLNTFVESIGQRNWLLISGPLSGLCWIYLIISLVGVWRSARRYEGWRIWRWLSWIFVAFGLYFLVRLLLMILVSFLAVPV